MSSTMDFLAIGDTVIDAFIRIKDASVTCDIDRHNCKLCLDFGSKVPYESVKEVPAVGNSANAAVAASRLGLSAGLVSNVGSDPNGVLCINHLHADGVDTQFVKVNEAKKTNYHYVLWFEDERTILIKHEDYEYHLGNVGTPKWIYLSSLGEKAVNLHDEISEFIEKNPETKLAFQPGTFQIKLGKERLKKIYEYSEVFFCNVEEAQKILSTMTSSIPELLKQMHALGPKIVVITDGSKGAYMYVDGKQWFMPLYPDPKPPYERTGAGDAFASTFIAALGLGLSPEVALAWAPINSMSVVQYIGAQEGLLTRPALEKLLKEAPVDYKVQALN